MSEQWPLKPLSEICEIRPAKSEVKGKFESTEHVSFVQMKDLGIGQMNIEHSETREFGKVYPNYTYFANDDVLLAKITPCFENGKLGIAQNLVNGIGFGSSEFIVLRPKKNVCKEWIYYFLSQKQFRLEGSKQMTGAVGHKRVSKDFIANYKIPSPPLEEQQRIVSILDDALDNIADSINNVQTVSNSVKELIETKLQTVFHEDSLEWEKIAFEESIVKVKATPKIKKRDFKEIGSYPIISQEMNFINGYWNNADDLLTIQTPVVVFGDHTKTLKYIDFDFVRGADGLKILQPIESILPKFFYHQLRSVKLKTLGYARHYRLLKQVEIRVPSMEQQHQIASMFDDLDEQVSHMNGLYERELQSLQELKQSIFQEAFSGKLTGGITA